MAYQLQPLPHLSTAPSRRYEQYVPQAHSHNCLEALNHWKEKTQATIEWQARLERGEGNRAIHILTPVVTCTLYHFPDEYAQQYLRRASHDPQIAINAARDALSLWLHEQGQTTEQGRGRKVLMSFYYTVYRDPGAGAHAQHVVGNINYTYRLENWTAGECAHEGSDKTVARQGAAQRLMQNRYCPGQMIPLNR